MRSQGAGGTSSNPSCCCQPTSKSSSSNIITLSTGTGSTTIRGLRPQRSSPSLTVHTPGSPGANPNAPAQYPSILVCYGDIPLKHRVIKVHLGFGDGQLMRNIRHHLRDMMGFAKYHTSYRGFGWCEFLELRAMNKEYLEKLGPGFPEEHDQAYIFEPRPPKRSPPISKHGWRQRYYHCRCVEGNDSTVRQVPKRKLAFESALLSEEIVYGLDIQLQPILWRVLVYQALILLGPLSFWIYWLTTHQGDWQNATALMIVTISLLEPLFMITLNGHLRA